MRTVIDWNHLADDIVFSFMWSVLEPPSQHLVLLIDRLCTPSCCVNASILAEEAEVKGSRCNSNPQPVNHVCRWPKPTEPCSSWKSCIYQLPPTWCHILYPLDWQLGSWSQIHDHRHSQISLTQNYVYSFQNQLGRISSWLILCDLFFYSYLNCLFLSQK